MAKMIGFICSCRTRIAHTHTPRAWICRQCAHRAHSRVESYFSDFKITDKFSKFEIIKVRLNFVLVCVLVRDASRVSRSCVRNFIISDFLLMSRFLSRATSQSHRNTSRIYLFSHDVRASLSHLAWAFSFRITFELWQWSVHLRTVLLPFSFARCLLLATFHRFIFAFSIFFCFHLHLAKACVTKAVSYLNQQWEWKSLHM